jgi:hypothetical protein
MGHGARLREREEDMSASGCSEFTISFSPIATSQGYRLLNAPAETGLTNRQF